MIGVDRALGLYRTNWEALWEGFKQAYVEWSAAQRAEASFAERERLWDRYVLAREAYLQGYQQH